jgi:hypothetical protein
MTTDTIVADRYAELWAELCAARGVADAEQLSTAELLTLHGQVCKRLDAERLRTISRSDLIFSFPDAKPGQWLGCWGYDEHSGILSLAVADTPEQAEAAAEEALAVDRHAARWCKAGGIRALRIR